MKERFSSGGDVIQGVGWGGCLDTELGADGGSPPWPGYLPSARGLPGGITAGSRRGLPSAEHWPKELVG